MAFRRDSTQPLDTIGGDNTETAAAPGEIGLAPARDPVAVAAWPSDDAALLAEMLRCHGLTEALVERLVGFATAPNHVKRPVDRLAIALGAQFNFLSLDEVWRTPILLCGLPGAGTSTLAAKLVARFDDSEVLVVSVGAHGADQAMHLAECLEVLDLPLTVAADAAALSRAVASAKGRKIVIDASGQSPLDQSRIEEFARAAGATGLLVASAETDAGDLAAAAEAASAIGIARMIVTHLDAARYLGGVLTAADSAKLALVCASVTPHFGFGLRALTPENLSRRLIAAALHAERWRVTPL